MKKAVIFTSAVILIAAALFGAVKLFSGSSTQKANAVADSFLTSFFAMEYDAAASQCTDGLGSILLEAVNGQTYPSEEIGTRVAEASKETVFKISSCEKTEEKNVVLVNYTVSPFGNGADIEHTMTIEKVDGEWKVSKLE